MAGIIALTGPSPTQRIISQYIDQYNQEQENQARNAILQQQVGQEGQFQGGQLQNLQNQFTLARQKYSDQQAMTQAKPWVQRFEDLHEAIAAAAGDPTKQAALQAQLKSETDDFHQSHPELVPYVATAMLSKVITPQYQAGVNAGNFAKTETGRAAAGSTDPNAFAIATKIATNEFPTTQMGTQQQAADVANQPAGPISTYEKQATGLTTTPAQQLTSTTNLQMQAMSDAAAMAREKFKEGALVAGVGDRDIKQTVSGAKYADISEYTGKLKNDLIAKYRSQGIPVLDKTDIAAIREIDNARLNQSLIAGTIVSHLPKDPTGRVAGGALDNKLSAFFQTDEYLAASGALRAAAIQALRATAGAKGLRINQAEIALAVQNDIPAITDTVGVALRKLQLVKGMIDSAEQSTLGTFNQTGAQSGAVSPGQAWAQHFTASQKVPETSSAP